MMCSSKRFLVHPQTLERLQDAGVQETLIEFMLADGASPSQFRRTYEDAGLPASGPFIDRSLIRMMNVLSDSTVIFLLFLVSLAVLAISLLCIRYILFLQLEQDRQQTGMMKALGISRKAVRQIYLVHYALLTVPGILAGLLAALILQRPLLKQLRELYGTAPDSSAVPLACLLAASVIALIVLISVRLSLHSLDRQSPLDALRNPQTFGRSGTRFMSAAVCAGCTFLVLVPLFLSHTLSSPGFVTSMGIGDAQLRLDLQSAPTADSLSERLQKDDRVQRWTLLKTYGESARLKDGSSLSLPVETGDLEAFPVTCDKGSLPRQQNELALSVLAARELDLEPGDILRLEGQSEPFVITGLYSDITNGGKTAKALHLKTYQAPVWTVGYVTLKEGADSQSWMESMSGAGIPVTSIRDYVRQTYAQTLHQLDLASQLAAFTGLFILCVVMFLAIRLSIQQNRPTLSLKKALGFTTGQLKREWFVRQISWCLGGTAAGLLLAMGPGQWLCRLVLEQLGATGFDFDIPCPATLAVLVLICAAALTATWCSLSVIRSVTPCECLRGKETS
ncbi:ABC transporter permease, partial [Faecalibaculum rodentium]